MILLSANRICGGIQFASGLLFLVCNFITLPASAFQADKSPHDFKMEWSQLPPLPDSEGLAGMFAGIVSGRLVVAGGANFPDGYPWEGGPKCWYDSIFVLESKAAPAWKELKLKLPRPLAYGVSFSVDGKLICAGGETGPVRGALKRTEPVNVADVFAIEFTEDEFRIQSLPALPHPVKDACGKSIGDKLFHFGGVETAKSSAASNQLWIMDLKSASPHWQEAEPFPVQGRIQAVAAAHADSFYLFSGIALVPDTSGNPVRQMPYLRDGWEYTPAAEPARGRWRRLQDMPSERAAAPGPAWPVGPDQLAIIGGADSERHKLPQKDHSGWSRNVLIYDFKSNSWETLVNAIPRQDSARVTAPTVNWGDEYMVISGEIAPGRRSPTVLILRSVK